MPISQGHRDLFRDPNTVDKLNFFQSLLDSKDLISDLALALINIIRSELERPQRQSASAYRRYSEVTGSLCKQMPEVYGQVVEAWQQRRQEASSVKPPPV
jgi:hypothetical protein